MGYEPGIYTEQGATQRVYKDNSLLNLGTDKDVALAFDGTKLTVIPAADDTAIEIGNGTNSADLKVYGNLPSAYLEHDASQSQLGLFGPMRPRGFNSLGRRYELRWVAGQRGKPSLNADIQNAAESTRMIADPDFEILGTNASSDDVTFHAEGGIKLETDGADGDEVIIVPHLDANQSAWEQVTWGTDQEVVWEGHLKTGSNITNTIIWAGLKLTNTEVKATDNDQVYFRYEDDVNSGKWEVVSSIDGTDTSTDTGVTAAINTEMHFKIAIGSDRTARCWLNGALVYTTAALKDATDLKPYIGVAADGAAAAKHMYVYGQAIGRKIA